MFFKIETDYFLLIFFLMAVLKYLQPVKRICPSVIHNIMHQLLGTLFSCQDNFLKGCHLESHTNGNWIMLQTVWTCSPNLLDVMGVEGEKKLEILYKKVYEIVSLLTITVLRWVYKIKVWAGLG